MVMIGLNFDSSCNHRHCFCVHDDMVAENLFGMSKRAAADADGRNAVIHDEIDKDNQYQCFTYTFDANNNRVGILDSNGSQTTYTYDAKDRISTAQTSGTINHTYTYTFDSRDNILSNSEQTNPVTMTYDAASRLVTSVQGTATTTYTFDVNGNMTNVEAGTNPMVEFSYDKENRLTDTGSETMSYYSSGLLRTKDKTFGEAILIWDGQDLLLAQDASSPSDFWHFGVVDGLVIYEQYSTSRKDLLVDYLGSVTGITESDGSGSSYTRYKPYGSTYTGAPATSFYGWTGQSGSQITGISWAEQYNRVRWISTKTRQFITRDPIWPGELPYGYVNGNCVTHIDPSGLFPPACIAACLLGAACAGAVWYACSDWETGGYSSFLDCTAQFVADLPWYSKVGGGLLLGGCLGCLILYAPKFPLPVPVGGGRLNPVPVGPGGGMRPPCNPIRYNPPVSGPSQGGGPQAAPPQTSPVSGPASGPSKSPINLPMPKPGMPYRPIPPHILPRMTGCKELEYKRLRDLQKFYCGGSACIPGESCASMYAKIARESKCADLRNTIHFKCFRGQDDLGNNHAQAIADSAKMISRCHTMIGQGQCT